MATKYFDTYEFMQAHNLSETDPITSKVLFERYLEKYPDDYSTYPYYCSVLMVLGEFEAAEKILNFVKDRISCNKKFNDPKKIRIFEQNIYFCQVKLLCYQKRFKELYNLYKSNPMDLKNRDLNSVWFYVKRQLGLLDEEKRDMNSYLFRQITKYDEEDFYDHISKHLSDCDDIENKSTCVFVPNFPVKEVVEEMKKYIPSDKKLYWGFYDNIYYFKYDGCGRDNTKLVNYIKVVCLDDTNNIITICPVVGSDNMPHIDLNYIKKEEPVKVKVKSQIDKFNQRYNRK